MRIDTAEIGIQQIQRAAARLKKVIIATPLVPIILTDPGGTPCYVKAESLQITGAFKIRGAYNAIASLSPAKRAHGIVATSSGNHAIGIALASRILGVDATIVMPKSAPNVKRMAVEKLGARVLGAAPSSEDWIRVAREQCRQTGAHFISSYDNADVIAGQGTIGLEIDRQLGFVDGNRGSNALTVLVPIGGGGLAAGVAVALKAVRPDVTIVGVEPAAAPRASAALARGEVVRWDAADVEQTIADGMRVVAVGELPLRLLRESLDAMVTVSDRELRVAMAFAATNTHLALEPAGAASIAAWLFRRPELPAGGTTVCIATGGNVDGGLVAEALRDYQLPHDGTPEPASVPATWRR